VDDDEFELLEADAYRAIGKYVVQFSSLVHNMRALITERLTVGSDEQDLAELAFGEVFPSQLSAAFFGMCRFTGDLDPAEMKVESALRNAVTKAFEMRNDIAHGDWWLGYLSPDGRGMDPPILVRIRPLRGRGASKVVALGAAELDALSFDLFCLSADVTGFGQLALGLPVLHRGTGERSAGEYRIRDVYGVERGKVVRSGPEAELIAEIYYLRPDL
jgi:hypothetical protein